MKKLLVFGVIILFLGLAIAPSINANLPKEQEYIITTELCGIKGYIPKNIQLTQKQADKLDIIFEGIKERLATAISQDEATQIIDDALTELRKNGIITQYEMEKARELIKTRYAQYKDNSIIQKALLQPNRQLNNQSNYFCTVAGESNNTFPIPPLAMGVGKLATKIFELAQYNKYIYLLLGLMQTHLILLSWNLLHPVAIWNGISFGSCVGIISNSTIEYGFIPAYGWSTSFGLLGKRTWEGTFYGQIEEIFFTAMFDFAIWNLIGIKGFTGIKIVYQSDEPIPDYYGCRYLGIASQENIGYETPEGPI